MTEAQRVGQLFLVGIAGDPVSDVAQAVAAYHFGSLLSAGNLTAGAAGLQQLTRGYQALASSRATGGVGFFIAANQEGGEVQSLQGPGFSAIPSALAQGSLSASVAVSGAQPRLSRSISVSTATCGSENNQVPPASHE